jgi:hypothetical protein
MTFLVLIILIAIVFVVARIWWGGVQSGLHGEHTGQPVQQRYAVDYSAFADDELSAALAANRKIEAIKRYRELTGADTGLKEAKAIIEDALRNPDTYSARKARLSSDSLSDAGVRDLIAAGRLDEAAELYRRFAGVDAIAAEIDDEGRGNSLRAEY